MAQVNKRSKMKSYSSVVSFFRFFPSWQIFEFAPFLVHCYLRFPNCHCFWNKYWLANQMVNSHRVVPTVCNMVFVRLLAVLVDKASSRFVSINFGGHKLYLMCLLLWCMMFHPAVLLHHVPFGWFDMELFNVFFFRSFFVLYKAWRIP